MIVDLAIVRDHVTLRGRGHRLVTCRREVHDRQAAMTEADARVCVEPNATVVWAAMHQRLGHRRQKRSIETGAAEDSGYPAHLTSPLTARSPVPARRARAALWP